MHVTATLETFAYGSAIAGSVGGYRFEEFEMGQDTDMRGTNKLASGLLYRSRTEYQSST